MTSVYKKHLIIIAYCLVFPLVACSGTSPKNSELSGPIRIVKSADFYQRLMTRPASGENSLVSIYVNLGKLSPQKYYEYIASAAPAADLIVDGRRFASPLSAIKQRQSFFNNLGAKFTTMADYWRTTGASMPQLGSLGEYKANLERALDQTSKSPTLGLLGSLPTTQQKTESPVNSPGIWIHQSCDSSDVQLMPERTQSAPPVMAKRTVTNPITIPNKMLRGVPDFDGVGCWISDPFTRKATAEIANNPNYTWDLDEKWQETADYWQKTGKPVPPPSMPESALTD